MINIKEVKIEFKISPELDISGFNILQNEIQKEHPLYSQFNKQKDGLKINDLYKDVADIYKGEDVQEKFKDISETWKKKEKLFLSQVSNLFENKKIYPRQEIIAYPTIWNVCMHNTEENAVSFSIFNENKDETIFEIIHELMHFFFLVYLNVVEEEYFSSLTGGELWQIMEVFNAIVLNRSEFKVFYSKFQPINYHSLDLEIKKMSKNLNKDFTISDFLKIYKNKDSL